MIAAAQGADRETIRTWLELQYGTDKGTAWISVGPGREAVKPFSDTPFAWPEQVEEIVDFIAKENEAGFNVWYAAHLSYSKAPKPEGEGRRECRSVKRRRLHFDIDRALTAEDTRKLAQLDAWLVYSGSPGHVHAYIELAESIDVALYHKLEDALKGHFDSDRSVCRDNGILRIPGTINQMSQKKRHPTALVLWDGKVSQTKWTPAKLKAELKKLTGTDLDAPQETAQVAEVSSDPITPVAPQRMPEGVRDALNASSADRSSKAARIINACKASGLSLEETLHCLLLDAGQAERYQQKGSAFMYKDVRKLYGTADQYNPQLADKAADDILGISGNAMRESQAGADPQTPARRLFLTLAELRTIPRAQPLIDGLLYQNTTAQLYGAPGTFKSFAALGMACAIASGQRQWESYPIAKSGPVLYVAAEGVSGIHDRLDAWIESTIVNDAAAKALLEQNFRIMPEAVQLTDHVAMGKVTAEALELCPVLIILDTRARMTAGLDENQMKDQSLPIDAIERLRAATGATVMVIHHSGKAGTSARGSNSWDGAVNSNLRLERLGDSLNLKIVCEKHKDVPDKCEHRFVMKTVTLAPLDDGKERSSLVMTNGRFDTGSMFAEENKTADGKAALHQLLCELNITEGFTRQRALKLYVDDLKAKGVEKLPHEATVYRWISSLRTDGKICETGRKGVFTVVP
ncbi:helicase RepA family protein [Rhodococcus qingshengii]|uniref:AAA family ATPase n=1 Tax=Rhodococcus qingshengii TaxID=334542 RepID=UPI001E2ED93D|nr:AAA family ATPase [Rhodococcus qingshengii]UGQ54261.1 helicase RepA family protein [Rhodococcus qingshengii]